MKDEQILLLKSARSVSTSVHRDLSIGKQNILCASILDKLNVRLLVNLPNGQRFIDGKLMSEDRVSLEIPGTHTYVF